MLKKTLTLITIASVGIFASGIASAVTYKISGVFSAGDFDSYYKKPPPEELVTGSYEFLFDTAWLEDGEVAYQQGDYVSIEVDNLLLDSFSMNIDGYDYTVENTGVKMLYRGRNGIMSSGRITLYGTRNDDTARSLTDDFYIYYPIDGNYRLSPPPVVQGAFVYTTSSVNDLWDSNYYEISDNVSTVPVPAAAWLFGSALIGLVGFKRKK